MKILSAKQTRAWDTYTITNEPITSVDLMNRAAQVFTDWLVQTYPDNTQPIVVFCGTGNNGGDGVAVARLLHWLGFEAKVLVCDFAEKRSADFEAQIAALPKHGNISVEWFNMAKDLPEIMPNALVIDALFGSGLNRPLEGEWAQVVGHLNQLPNEVVSIDLPSGLISDEHTAGESVVHADRTFSFERPKLAFFFPENAERVGEWVFESIRLHPDFERKTDSIFHLLTKNEASALFRPRPKFSHKGRFGHALLVAGSFGKMGAAVLAAKSCLRSGVGLLTVHAPRSGNIILQGAVPEAMVSADHRAKYWAEVPDLQAYSSIGVGPGIGKEPETAVALQGLLQGYDRPMVLDADALNLLAENPAWWKFIPQNSILTPHPKEFERLFGKTKNDFQRNDLQRYKAHKHGVFIVLKGAHTAIACPDGECWFNSTGNPGMATGGTGDVLSGLLTGLLAQGYPPKSAALLGVYLHGLAGDLAAAAGSQEALTAGDLVDYLGRAWLGIGCL
ncbi:MAG: NAD(P)H-hydrate dehydratase [Saprospiraceae bacterium]|nr:NAD(P)H-hydrate dehydratase [Saprospiraceae bacterium]